MSCVSELHPLHALEGGGQKRRPPRPLPAPSALRGPALVSLSCTGQTTNFQTGLPRAEGQRWGWGGGPPLLGEPDARPGHGLPLLISYNR